MSKGIQIGPGTEWAVHWTQGLSQSLMSDVGGWYSHGCGMGQLSLGRRQASPGEGVRFGKRSQELWSCERRCWHLASWGHFSLFFVSCPSKVFCQKKHWSRESSISVVLLKNVLSLSQNGDRNAKTLNTQRRADLEPGLCWALLAWGPLGVGAGRTFTRWRETTPSKGTPRESASPHFPGDHREDKLLGF